MLHDSLLDASLFFFTVWSLVVGAISITAFGPDLLVEGPLRVEVADRSQSLAEM